jgi:hypothetical protein
VPELIVGRAMAITEMVFRVWHPLAMVGGGYVSDLIFRDGKPLLVVEWDKSHKAPAIVVELERQHLHSITETPSVQYLYAAEIDVPGR